jgi:hypothetical protein
MIVSVGLFNWVIEQYCFQNYVIASQLTTP